MYHAGMGSCDPRGWSQASAPHGVDVWFGGINMGQPSALHFAVVGGGIPIKSRSTVAARSRREWCYSVSGSRTVELAGGP